MILTAVLLLTVAQAESTASGLDSIACPRPRTPPPTLYAPAPDFVLAEPLQLSVEDLIGTWRIVAITLTIPDTVGRRLTFSADSTWLTAPEVRSHRRGLIQGLTTLPLDVFSPTERWPWWSSASRESPVTADILRPGVVVFTIGLDVYEPRGWRFQITQRDDSSAYGGWHWWPSGAKIEQVGYFCLIR